MTFEKLCDILHEDYLRYGYLPKMGIEQIEKFTGIYKENFSKLSKSDKQYVRVRAKKIVALKFFANGKCFEKGCHECSLMMLQGHHIDPSTKCFDINIFIRANSEEKSPLELEIEMKKCRVACPNCHSSITADQNKHEVQIKRLILDKMGINCCCKCSYDKDWRILQFHHIDKKAKTVNLSQLWKKCYPKKSIDPLSVFYGQKSEFTGDVISPVDSVIPNEILTELSKCQLLCPTCHARCTTDEAKFKRFEMFALFEALRWYSFYKPMENNPYQEKTGKRYEKGDIFVKNEDDSLIPYVKMKIKDLRDNPFGKVDNRSNEEKRTENMHKNIIAYQSEV